MKDVMEIVEKMSLEQKALFLTGSFTHGLKTHESPEYGIPAVMMMDGPLGLRNGNSTIEGGNACIPSLCGIAASWDRQVAFDAAAAIADDFVEEGYDVVYGPGVNMKRHPYCGRNFEYFSEDPVLAGVLGAEYVKGLQSKGVAACVKHYAVNNQELDRLFMNVDVDERTLREYYLKVYEVLLKHCNPEAIMCAYNKINGIWCSENEWLLKEVLRGDFHYDGMVVSDWGAVHDVVKCVKAGLTMEEPCNRNIVAQIKEGVERGKLSEEAVNEACACMLQFAFRVSGMERNPQPYDRKKQHATMQRLAAETMTLLKNDKDVLPVTNKKYKKIGVYGKHAERPTAMGSGAAKVETKEAWIDKPIDYIKTYCEEEGIELVYSPLYEDGFNGAELVGKVNSLKYNELDAIICFIGNNYGGDVETEYWDRDNITFPNYLNGIVEAACNSCENVIVVMQTGSATIPTRWHRRVQGVVQMWYGGEGGGKAIADVLFGKVNPSAKLSETFLLKHREDMDYVGNDYTVVYREGLEVGYRYYDSHPEYVWFPFGHGLSYTQFAYSDMTVTKKDEFNYEVTCKITNIGDRDGSEVVQLYVGQKNATVTRPPKELKGFDKVFLKAGETKEVKFALEENDFAYYNICLKKWHVESGSYDILIAASAADIRLQETVKIENPDDYTTGGRKSDHIMA